MKKTTLMSQTTKKEIGRAMTRVLVDQIVVGSSALKFASGGHFRGGPDTRKDTTKISSKMKMRKMKPSNGLFRTWSERSTVNWSGMKLSGLLGRLRRTLLKEMGRDGTMFRRCVVQSHTEKKMNIKMRK